MKCDVRSDQPWDYGARRRPFRPESLRKAHTEEKYGNYETGNPACSPPSRGIAAVPATAPPYASRQSEIGVVSS